MTLERIVGVVLRAGVIASSVCLSAGLLLFLATGGGALAGVLLNAGIVILLATPVARVIVSTARYVGSIVRRRLGLETFRLGGTYYVSLGDRERLDALKRRYGIEELPGATPV